TEGEIAAGQALHPLAELVHRELQLALLLRLLGIPRRTVLLGDEVGACGLALEAALLQRAILENLDGLRHAADLVIGTHDGHFYVGVTACKARHRLTQAPEAS